MAASALLCVAAVAPQVSITSLDPKGELSWTSSMDRGFYNVERADQPAGPWRLLATIPDLDGTVTNRITAQVPLTNAQAFYRVAWLRPDPIGVWDYRGYDFQSNLVITGRLTIASMSLSSSNPTVVYDLQGSWDLQYAGPPTNVLWGLDLQIGAGSLCGSMTLETAFMCLYWPTNSLGGDNVMLDSSILGPSTYTGRWHSGGFVEYSGPFIAERR